MKPWGQFSRKLMTCGEGPGENEDKRGKPWQGKAGTLFSDTLKDLDIDLERDCLSTNSVLCRPPNNRTPTGHEQACCRSKFLYPEIETSQPKVILLLGGV